MAFIFKDNTENIHDQIGTRIRYSGIGLCSPSVTWNGALKQ
jgi:hypothetical protein